MNFFDKVSLTGKITLAALLFTATGCKKDPKINANGQNKQGTREQLTKDSIFLYAKETYFWNELLPSYEQFNPRQYSGIEATVEVLKKYSPANPGENPADPDDNNLDKYSFIDDGSVGTELGGVSTGDYGFSVFFNNDQDLRIKYVYGTSPANTGGLVRGDQITSINGKTDLNTTKNSIQYIVDAIFGSKATLALKIKKKDGTQQDVSLSKGVYNINPILYKNVYNAGDKKVGYLVYNSFTTNSSNNLNTAFKDFTNQGVSEVIVDLRYNGGGSVGTAIDIVNSLVPAGNDGEVMMTTYFNQTMQQGKATILKNQVFRDEKNELHNYAEYDYSPAGYNVDKFKKIAGTPNLSRVYFLVTGSTASASELVINSLKPVVDVKVIGTKTYGKPVGFFPIHIDKYDLYIPQFQTKNQLGQGDYFSGIQVDKVVTDDVTVEFGDPSEKILQNALNFAATGNFLSVNPKTASLKTGGKRSAAFIKAIPEITSRLSRKEFKGMIFFR